MCSQHRCTVGTGEKIDDKLGCVARCEGGYRVLSDRRIRDLYRVDRATRSGHIGGVNHPGVRLAKRHFGEHGPNVLFIRRCYHHNTGISERYSGIAARWHRRVGEHDDEFITVEVIESANIVWIARFDRNDETVGCENDWDNGDASPVERSCHRRPVGGCEYIGRCAIGDLGGQAC